MKRFDYYFCPECGEDRRAADKRERPFVLARRPVCPDCDRPLVETALWVLLNGLAVSALIALVFVLAMKLDGLILAGIVLLGSAVIAVERWAWRRAARRRHAAGHVPSETAAE